MNGSLHYSALTRLLTLNNQAHDLENQILMESVPVGARGSMISAQMALGSRIAQIQEEIDRTVRASLTICWLGNSDAEGEDYEF